MLGGLVTAFVFALGGIAKWDDPTDAIVFAVKGLGLSTDLAQRLVLMTAAGELLLAAWLAYDLGRTPKPGVASLLVIGLFCGLLLAVAQAHPRSTWSCGCFGALQAPFGGRTLWSHFRFNLVLSLVVLAHLASVRLARRLTCKQQGKSPHGPVDENAVAA